MELFLSTTNVLISIWVAFAIIMLFIVARTDLDISKKMIIVPLTFLALYVTINDTIGLLGYPYDGKPDGEVQIIHHEVREELETRQKFILLWYRDADGDRMIRFPWNKKTEKQLRQSKERKEKGIQQMGKFQKSPPSQNNQKGNKGETQGGELRIYDFPHQQRLPKNSQ